MSFASHARWCDYEPLQAINNGVSYGYSSPLEMAETEGLRGVFASPLTAVEFVFVSPSMAFLGRTLIATAVGLRHKNAGVFGAKMLQELQTT